MSEIIDIILRLIKSFLPALKVLKKEPIDLPVVAPVVRWKDKPSTIMVTGTWPKYTNLKRHNGIDFAARKADRVYSICQGVVSEVVVSVYGKSPASYVAIDTGSEVIFYRHCGAALVGFGDDVKRGEVLGYIDNSGKWAGYHLHFEVQRGGKPIEPIQVLFKHQPKLIYTMQKGRWNGKTILDMFKKYNPEGLEIVQWSKEIK